MTKRKYFIVVVILLSIGFWLVSAHLEKVIQLHFQYKDSRSHIFQTGVSLDIEETSTDLWFLLSQAENFQKTDIPQFLDSNQREQNLEAYLRDGDNLLISLASQQLSLESELQNIQNQISLCQNTLSAANELFTVSLKDNHEQGFYQAVDQARWARSCLWEQEVMKNALQNLLSKLQWNQKNISPKITYLKNNKELIIKHYDILKPSLLAELYKISVMLENE